MTEFNLSEEGINYGTGVIVYTDKSAKKFIKLLKEDATFCILQEDTDFMIKQIEKRAGEKLK